MILVPCPWCEAGRDALGFYCGNCQGLTRVVQGSADEACRHEWEHAEWLGRCLRLERCAVCWTERTIDSS